MARIPTEWNQEKAQAGLVNALQANPDISFIFTSSDFLFPSIVSRSEVGGQIQERSATEGHVLLGGFDGDATAYQMLVDGYLDADGVQDVYFEAAAAVQAVLDLKAGQTGAGAHRRPWLRDSPGQPPGTGAAHVGGEGQEVTRPMVPAEGMTGQARRLSTWAHADPVLRAPGIGVLGPGFEPGLVPGCSAVHTRVRLVRRTWPTSCRACCRS